MSERQNSSDFCSGRRFLRAVRKNGGFTFTEMLLVLAVVMTVVAISIPAYKGYAEKQEERRFFETLLHDIYAIQSESYANASAGGINFRRNLNSYDIVHSFHGKVEIRPFPKSVKLSATSNLTSIYFASNGSISASGTIHFDTSTGWRSLIVHLGKGRVVLSE